MKMNRHVINLPVLAAFAATALATVPAPAQQAPAAAVAAPTALNAQTAPDVLVRTLATDVLDTIRADKTLQSGDPAKLNELVDRKILPYVNFEKMTQLAVGRGWRQATPEQRQALTRAVRTLLVRTYSGAVSQVRDQWRRGAIRSRSITGSKSPTPDGRSTTSTSSACGWSRTTAMPLPPRSARAGWTA